MRAPRPRMRRSRVEVEGEAPRLDLLRRRGSLFSVYIYYHVDIYIIPYIYIYIYMLAYSVRTTVARVDITARLDA